METKCTIIHHLVGRVTGTARRPDDLDPFEPDWLPGAPSCRPPTSTWLIVDDDQGRGDFCAFDHQVVKGTPPA